MGKETKAVAKAAPQVLATVPEFMKGLAGAGTENLGAADVEVPRIKLLQALSPEVQEGDFKANTFFHTVAEESLGSEVEIIPVFIEQSFILWRPRNSGGGILARSMDGIHWTPAVGEFDVKLNSGKQVKWKLAPTVAASGLADWGSSDPDDPNSQPAATRMYNVVVVMPDFVSLSPAVLTMQRSAIKVARKFIGRLRLSNAPAFGQKFIMSGVKDSSTAGEFFNFKFTPNGLVEDRVTFDLCRELYEAFRKKGVKVGGIEGLEGEGAEAPASAGTGEDI